MPPPLTSQLALVLAAKWLYEAVHDLTEAATAFRAAGFDVTADKAVEAATHLFDLASDIWPPTTEKP